MKIPVEKLGVDSPVAGTKLQAEIFRCASREPTRKLLSWQVIRERNFHVPERFGTLALTAP